MGEDHGIEFEMGPYFLKGAHVGAHTVIGVEEAMCIRIACTTLLTPESFTGQQTPQTTSASFLQWNPHLQWHIAMSWHTVEGYGRAPRSKGEVDNIMILESSQRLKTYLDFFFWPEGAPGIILPQ